MSKYEEKDVKDVKKLYDKLSENNKDVVNIIARAMTIAQEKAKKGA